MRLGNYRKKKYFQMILSNSESQLRTGRNLEQIFLFTNESSVMRNFAFGDEGGRSFQYSLLLFKSQDAAAVNWHGERLNHGSYRDIMMYVI